MTEAPVTPEINMISAGEIASPAPLRRWSPPKLQHLSGDETEKPSIDTTEGSGVTYPNHQPTSWGPS